MLLVLDWYYKVAIFELEMRKCTSRTRLVLQSCIFEPDVPKFENTVNDKVSPKNDNVQKSTRAN